MTIDYLGNPCAEEAVVTECPDCNACAIQFARNNGCELLLSGTEQEVQAAIPGGCYPCGPEAHAYCSESDGDPSCDSEAIMNYFSHSHETVSSCYDLQVLTHCTDAYVAEVCECSCAHTNECVTPEEANEKWNISWNEISNWQQELWNVVGVDESNWETQDSAPCWADLTNEQVSAVHALCYKNADVWDSDSEDCEHIRKCNTCAVQYGENDGCRLAANHKDSNSAVPEGCDDCLHDLKVYCESCKFFFILTSY